MANFCASYAEVQYTAFKIVVSPGHGLEGGSNL